MRQPFSVLVEVLVQSASSGHAQQNMQNLQTEKKKISPRGCYILHVRCVCGFGAKRGRCEHLDCISHLCMQCSAVQSRGVNLRGRIFCSVWCGADRVQDPVDKGGEGRMREDGELSQWEVGGGGWVMWTIGLAELCSTFFLGFLLFCQGKMRKRKMKDGEEEEGEPLSLRASNAHLLQQLICEKCASRRG